MSVSNKLSALLKSKDKSLKDYSDLLGISYQGVKTKFLRDSFSVDDLILIANDLDCKVKIIGDDIELTLTPDDLHLVSNGNTKPTRKDKK